jgi:hypothetical protein
MALGSTQPLIEISKMVKVPLTDPKAQKGDRGIALHSLDLSARRGWVVSTTPRPLYLREGPGTHCTGDWLGPRAGLDVCEKPRLPPGFDPRTVQPVASHYTNCYPGQLK